MRFAQHSIFKPAPGSHQPQRLLRPNGRRASGRHGGSLDRETHDLEPPPVDAIGVPLTVRRIQTGRSAREPRRLTIHTRLKDSKPTPVDLGKGTRKRRRHGAHQVVYLTSAAAPVNAPILRSAPAEIRPKSKIEGARLRPARHQ